MKRYILFVFVLAFILSACDGTWETMTLDGGAVVTAAPEKITPVRTPQPTTSRGTPINDEFDISAVSMQSTPESSCFSEIGYDADREILVVTFRSSGAAYLYYDFSGDMWELLLSSSSKGEFYNAEIKGDYYCEKVG